MNSSFATFLGLIHKRFLASSPKEEKIKIEQKDIKSYFDGIGSTMSSNNVNGPSLSSVSISPNSPLALGPQINSPASVGMGAVVNTSAGYSTSGQTQYNPHASSISSYSTYNKCITLTKSSGEEIVSLQTDGTVVWKDNVYAETEAAKAFGRTIKLGAEYSLGLTESVKRAMRDTVFNELVEIAKEAGPLDANQLQFLHRSAKIIDKLKGNI